MKHSFYRKPMAPAKTMMAQSAFPTNMKRAILVEEGMRKLRNNSPEMRWEEKGAHLTQIARDMRRSGHKEHFRMIVLEKAAAKYKALLRAHESGEKNLYRTRGEREKEKDEKKGERGEKESWYKGKQGFTSNLVIPATAGGQLETRMKRAVRGHPEPEGMKVKVAQANGRSISSFICPPDPFVRVLAIGKGAQCKMKWKRGA